MNELYNDLICFFKNVKKTSHKNLHSGGAFKLKEKSVENEFYLDKEYLYFEEKNLFVQALKEIALNENEEIYLRHLACDMGLFYGLDDSFFIDKLYLLKTLCEEIPADYENYTSPTYVHITIEFFLMYYALGEPFRKITKTYDDYSTNRKIGVKKVGNLGYLKSGEELEKHMKTIIEIDSRLFYEVTPKYRKSFICYSFIKNVQKLGKVYIPTEIEKKRVRLIISAINFFELNELSSAVLNLFNLVKVSQKTKYDLSSVTVINKTLYDDALELLLMLIEKVNYKRKVDEFIFKYNRKFIEGFKHQNKPV